MWMLVSGALLPHRGALFPALQSTGISQQAIRRAWGAFRGGMWQISELMVAWDNYMRQQQRWQPRRYESFYAVAIDNTPFWRPKLKNLKTKYFNSVADKALPAVVIGLIARIGEVNGKRIALPQAMVRVHPKDPSEETLKEELLKQVKRLLQPSEILLADAGFKLKMCQEAGITQFLLRLPKNFTARRNWLVYKAGKKGVKPGKGKIVRPLSRKYRGNEIAATNPDTTLSWQLSTGETIKVHVWYDLVRPDITLDQGEPLSLFDVYAIFDPRYDKPLLVATNVKLAAETVWQLYTDRWPIEQLPLAAKQMIGAHRQYVFAEESRHRLPELVILAGSILTCLAALHPAMPTGFWDRDPQPTPGRYRRALMGLPFPQSYSLPARIRRKESVTTHFLKGILGHRRQKQDFDAIST
ncbi:MAG TPA: hypothetical protein ENJ93_03305 [Chloroflexi bacterium]|nr:hypothetical protein [Chloroflexota bacterium]